MGIGFKFVIATSIRYAMSVEIGDVDWVVDAFHCGNAGRFLNSSCDANCTVKTQVSKQNGDTEAPLRFHGSSRSWDVMPIEVIV